jgi:hypothetical protein
MQALRFLQTEVAEVADRASAEGDVLRELIAPLVQVGRPAPSSPTAATSPEAVTPETFRARREVFEQPMVSFPSEAKESSTDLAGVGGEIDHEWQWNNVVSWRCTLDRYIQCLCIDFLLSSEAWA